MARDQRRLVQSTAAESAKATGSLVAILKVREMANRSPKGLPKANPSGATGSNANAIRKGSVAETWGESGACYHHEV